MSTKPHILLTLLEEDPGLARTLAAEFTRLGADCSAHFWFANTDAQALSALIPEVCHPGLSAWVIAGTAASLARKDIRQGLSLAALAAQAARRKGNGSALPVVVSPSGTLQDSLPQPLADADIVARGLGARTIARIHGKNVLPACDYRLDVHALPGLGLWLEVGPARDQWDGVLLGSAPCEPDAHGVGQAGVIPERCTLHHPSRGLKLALGEKEFTAWGTENTLSLADSYFVRLTGLPETLVFGAFPKEDDADLYVLNLC